MTTLYLVRHGQSEWNRRGRIQGQADSPLTELGRQQAALIGRHLRSLLEGVPLRVFSSPLGRAQETADIITSHLGHAEGTFVVDDRLNDFRLGILSGYHGWDRVADAHPELARLRLDDPLRFHPPDGESGADVIVRIESFLADLPSDGHAALIVCHGVINKFIRSVRLGVTGPGIIALGESQYTVYRVEGGVETTIDLESAEKVRMKESED